MTQQPIQNYYAEVSAICYGCGRKNEHGHHVKTYWDGEEGICHFMPESYHTAFPGVVYGGLLASIIDCHTIGTATAARYTAEGREPGSDPELTHVTGNLNVSFLKPTPVGVELELRARIKEMHPKKAIVACSVYANGEETVRSEVIAVKVSSRMFMAE